MSSMIPRTSIVLIAEVIEDFNKMAFVSGPRQVGKTTIAKTYQTRFEQSIYLNWDFVPHQKKILTDPTFFERENRDPAKPFLIVFDEIHKYARWKNYLKGAYDQYREEFRFLITGSGRLELFKRRGDSLMGRYFSVPLFPLTVGELTEKLPSLKDFRGCLKEPPKGSKEISERYTNLFRFGGFPEPFSRGSVSFYNRWSAERRTLLVREDIRDVSAVREISSLEHLTHLLPGRIGNPFSINAVREDLNVAFETVRLWLLLLERFFFVFRISPFSVKTTRTLRKEPKLYLFDWAELEKDGVRFENLVALHLLKAVSLWKAMGEEEVRLNYIRDREKREVDFVLSEKGKPLCLIECKEADENPSPSLLYFQTKLAIPVAVQLVHRSGISKKLRTDTGILWIISADRWLSALP
jgi:predicted AAA+ superfamily ATPase